ncbi:MAG: FecR family protein [Cyanobacteria bacterium J06638_7]
MPTTRSAARSPSQSWPPATAARSGAVLLVLMAAGLVAPAPQAASPPPVLPRVVSVPSRPGWVQPPGTPERPAAVGQTLVTNSLVRTSKPGRLQVQLADGRSFRLGGEALLRVSPRSLKLLRGQIIAWVTPGSPAAGPLEVRTRSASASIEGTTLFVDAGERDLRLFSWEGRVRVVTDAGDTVILNSGEELAFLDGAWQPPRRLSREQAAERSARSHLLRDFDTPMETLPLIEEALEIEVR